MTVIHLADPEVSRLRIAVSPLWEVFASIATLEAAEPSPWPHREWERLARRTLSRRRAAGELLAWFRRLPSSASTLLTPVPAGAGRGIDEHLEELRRVICEASPERLAGLGLRADQTGDWVTWLVAGVLDYWHGALAPYWPAMRTALQDELAARALNLAVGGAAGLLSDLDPRVSWRSPVLEIPGDHPEPVRCADRLILVPMIFGQQAVRWVADEAGSVAVGYQSRGATVLAKPRRGTDTPAAPECGDRLALLLGRGRAAVLRGLAEPATTSQLAVSLAMSASTVSQHLSTLVAADVAHRRRDGGRVVYALDTAGLALLRYLGPDPE